MRCYLCYLEDIVISVVDNPEAARRFLLQRRSAGAAYVECWDAAKGIRLYIEDTP